MRSQPLSCLTAEGTTAHGVAAVRSSARCPCRPSVNGNLNVIGGQFGAVKCCCAHGDKFDVHVSCFFRGLHFFRTESVLFKYACRLTSMNSLVCALCNQSMVRDC